jgi:hypothetical protein
MVSGSMIQLSGEQTKDAVISLFIRDTSVGVVVQGHGSSRRSLYKLKKEDRGEESQPTMKQH